METDRRSSPNLGFFTVAYFGGLLLAALVTYAVAAFAGIELPSAGVGIAVFGAATLMAGNRYAKSVDWEWTRADRHTLAWQYSLAACLLQLVFAGLLIALAGPAVFGLEPDALTDPALLVIMLVAVAIYGLGYYVFARILFGSMVKQQARLKDRQARSQSNSDLGAGV